MMFYNIILQGRIHLSNMIISYFIVTYIFSYCDIDIIL